MHCYSPSNWGGGNPKTQQDSGKDVPQTTCVFLKRMRGLDAVGVNPNERTEIVLFSRAVQGSEPSELRLYLYIYSSGSVWYRSSPFVFYELVRVGSTFLAFVRTGLDRNCGLKL